MVHPGFLGEVQLNRFHDTVAAADFSPSLISGCSASSLAEIAGFVQSSCFVALTPAPSAARTDLDFHLHHLSSTSRVA